MNLIRIITPLFILLVFSFCSQKESRTENTDILIIGGGTSGVAAAIQAARMDVNVILVEETEWLGGMLTSAAVSATDGNHNLPSGIWGEFRNRLYDHYGSPQAIATGWVSNTHFEPSVGDSILKAMVAELPAIKVLYHTKLLSVGLSDNGMIQSVSFADKEGNNFSISAKSYIDATELGDVIGMANIPHRVGQDAASLTGESLAPETATPYIQDLTFCAVLEDYGSNGAPVIPMPEGYDPAEFNCSCKESCDDPENKVVDCKTMLEYARLPNGKFLINWPTKGNDHYVNPIGMTSEEREKAYQEAKQTTLRFIYHIQNTLGFKNLGISDDEFPTPDGLALIPYHRESRRIVAKEFVTANDLKEPYARNLYQQAIAVGDYPLDHHHKKNPLVTNEFTPETDFPIPSFSVPLGALIPEKGGNLIAAEKSIGVSHLANGSTRLQPCVLGIGQAAGTLAALAAKTGVTPDLVPLRSVQKELLASNAYLLPFFDIKPSEKGFDELQILGVTGLLKGHGVPYKWANQTWIYPDSAVSVEEYKQIAAKLPDNPFESQLLDRQSAINHLYPDVKESADGGLNVLLEELGWIKEGSLVNNDFVTRRELAILINNKYDLLSLN